MDNGLTWEQIAENINTDSNSFLWSPEVNVSDECMFKLIDEGDVNIYGISKTIKIIDQEQMPTISYSSYPADKEEKVSLNLTISWTNGNNTEKITLYFGEENPPQNIVKDNVKTTSYNIPVDSLEYNTTYYWKVDCMNEYGIAEGEVWSFTTKDNPVAVEKLNGKQTEFALAQNYPNPFNPTTTIKYELKEAVNLTLKVYDSLGRLVKTIEEGIKPAGRYEVSFNARSYGGSDLSSGMYFYRLQSDKFNFTKKMLMIK